jgi:hypothetical protein
MSKAGIAAQDMTPMYFSPDPYHKAFKDRLDILRYEAYNKPTGGMVFNAADGRLVLRDIFPRSTAAKIPAWRTRIRGAWLRKVGTTMVLTEEEVAAALAVLSTEGADHCQLTFSHPEVSRGLIHAGILQVNLDQMNS